MRALGSCLLVIGAIAGFLSGVALTEETEDTGKLVYVKVEKENLRNAPNGQKIGELSRSAEMEVLEEKDKWVKVKITAWIWKPSTTPDKAQIAKLKREQKKAGTQIAGGFVYKNVSFKSSYGGYVDVIGEMTNNSGKSYTLANFTISVYDKDDNLLATGGILISNFNKGQTKSFDAIIEADYDRLTKYKIDFESGL